MIVYLYRLRVYRLCPGLCGVDMRSAMVLICCFGLVCSFFMAHLSLEDFAPARELVTGFIFVAGLKKVGSLTPLT